METWKSKFFIKINFISRYKYDLSTQEVYIHIPKHNWVHNMDLHEKQMTQRVYMYILKFDKINIYMKWKHINIKQTQE